MTKPITVREYMSANLVTFTPDMEILRAINALVEKRISGATVVDKRGNVIGMLSEQDCMKVALHAGYYGDHGGRVSEYMTTEVKTIDADTSILELAELFLHSPYRRYPVMQDNRLVGQISRRDVLRAMEKLS